MSSSQTQLKHFLPISKLGQGAFSTVYQVKRITDGLIYALKKIKIQKLKPKEKQNSLNQIRILASIKSKYIILYKQAFYDHNLNLLCIVMQYANQGDLQKKITQKQNNKKNFTQDQIWKAAGQILIGLYILHQKNILHRDLKSANVFISNNQYKLGDLNVSKINQQKNQLAKTQTGTPYYASPQVWRDQPYDSKCDIWSYGCLLYQMCTFQPPFQGIDLDDLYNNVQRGKFNPIPSIFSNQLALLIKKCLTVSPFQRPKTQQLVQEFPRLKWKFMQSLQKNQIQISNNLLNTIKVPFDLRDLTKSLPIAEYTNPAKQNQKTGYQIQSSKKQNSVEKKQFKSQRQIKKQILPLPERIKSYLNQSQKKIIKRPQRLLTSIKKRQQIKTLPKQERPLTAVNKQIQIQKSQRKIRKIPYTAKINLNNKNQISKNIQSANKKFLKQEIIQQNRSLPFVNRIELKKIQIRNKSRCSSASSSLNNSSKRRIVSSANNKNYVNQNYNQKNLSKQKYIDILQIQKGKYQKCKQISIKRIDSLQNKVKYIRDHRKQRKYLFQQNKQNQHIIQNPKNENKHNKISILKQTNPNLNIIKNDLQRQFNPIKILDTKKVINKNQKSGIIYNPIQSIDHLSNIRKRLQLRKQKLNISRRYIMSAQGKKQNNSLMENNNQKIIDCSIEYLNDIAQKNKNKKAFGIIRRIPSSRLPSILIKNSQSLVMQKRNKSHIINSKMQSNNLQDFETENLLQKQKQIIQSLIDDNQTILRLKKRIKNRILCENNIHQKKNMQKKNIQYKKLINEIKI